MNSQVCILTLLGSQEARLLIESLLADKNYKIIHGSPLLSPLEMVRLQRPDLVIVEMDMPGISGTELVCRIRKDPFYSDLAVIGVGGEDDRVAQKVALVAGCSGFVPYPLDPSRFPDSIEAFLSGERESLSEEESIQIQKYFSDSLIEELEKRLGALEKKTLALMEERERQKNLILQVLTSLATLLDAKDSYTHGHSDRVTRLSLLLGTEINLKGEDLKTLERAALLHDIGKIAIDLAQIHKPGPLSPEEWEKVKEHSETGYKILSSLDFLQDEALIVKNHHYKFHQYKDNPAIPRRIRVLTCILTIADSFDAMTTHRSYNTPRTLEEAKKELVRCSGSQFDPLLVEAFIRLLDKVPSGIQR